MAPSHQQLADRRAELNRLKATNAAVLREAGEVSSRTGQHAVVEKASPESLAKTRSDADGSAVVERRLSDTLAPTDCVENAALPFSSAVETIDVAQVEGAMGSTASTLSESATFPVAYQRHRQRSAMHAVWEVLTFQPCRSRRRRKSSQVHGDINKTVESDYKINWELRTEKTPKRFVAFVRPL